MLEKFRKSKQSEVDMLHKLEEEDKLPTVYGGERLSLLMPSGAMNLE